jgi:hypothetical protein
MVFVVGSIIVAGIFFFWGVATTNTSLTVDLQYKGVPYSGTVRVIGASQGTSYSRNGSSVQFSLPDGVYDVSAFYTNSSGTFYTGYWVRDMTHGTVFIGYHMTIELSNNTAWY